MNLSRFTATTLGLIVMLAGAKPSARAQADVMPPEVAALFDDIMDIDKLRVLNPLKLKPDQIDKLITTIKKSQADYDKALADAAVPPIRQISKDIKDTRRRMLEGGAIPKDFD